MTLSAGLVIRVASSQARPTYCAVRMVRKSCDTPASMSVRCRICRWMRSRSVEAGVLFYRSEFAEAVTVIHIVPVVKPKSLFVDVAEQVERLDIHVGSLESAFEQTPEVFQSVRVNLTVNVPFTNAKL